MSRNKSQGALRIGIVTSTDSSKFRCDVSYLGTYQDSRSVPTNPNANFGVMPEVGSLVACYDHPGIGTKVIAVLDKPGNASLDEMLIREDKAGYVPNCNDGEAFIGGSSGGRAHFDNQGNVIVSSQMHRAVLELTSDQATALIYGNNFDFYSQGKNARVHSKTTITDVPPLTWGDSLYMEVNIPASPLPASQIQVPPTTLGRFAIQNNGSLEATALPGTAVQTGLQISPLGSIDLGRGDGTTPISINIVGMSVSTLNAVDIFNPLASMFIGPDGRIKLLSTPGFASLTLDVDKSIKLTNLVGTFSVDAAGNVVASNANSQVKVAADGSFLIAPIALTPYMISANAVGDVSVIGKSVGISATTSVALAGTMVNVAASASSTIASPLIRLGAVPAGHVAYAEALVLIFAQLNALNLAIKTHTHVVNGVVLATGNAVISTAMPSAELAAAVVPPVPTPSGIGSTTVSAQA